MNDLYKQCYKAFRADEHEWLQNKFIYVTINSTIQRLNELRDYSSNIEGTPVPWSLEHKSSTIIFNPNKGKNGEYESTCAIELTIPGLGTRMGYGAASNFDIDNATKSSQAFGCRKGANQFGVAHYLLMNPEKESDLVKHLLANDPDDSDAMKEGVVQLMKIRKLDISAANMISEFGVTLDQLKNDSEVWTKILRGENRI